MGYYYWSIPDMERAHALFHYTVRDDDTGVLTQVFCPRFCEEDSR